MLEYEHFKTLPELVLRRHFPDRLGDEDILQEGRVELLKALAEQRKAKNFFAWAYKRIYRAYIRYIRDEWPDHTDIDEVGVADPTSQTHEDVIDLCETVSHLLRRYPMERKAICLRLHGLSYAAIAREMGKSISSVRRLIQSGKARIKQAMEGGNT